MGGACNQTRWAIGVGALVLLMGGGLRGSDVVLPAWREGVRTLPLGFSASASCESTPHAVDACTPVVLLQYCPDNDARGPQRLTGLHAVPTRPRCQRVRPRQSSGPPTRLHGKFGTRGRRSPSTAHRRHSHPCNASQPAPFPFSRPPSPSHSRLLSLFCHGKARRARTPPHSPSAPAFAVVR